MINLDITEDFDYIKHLKETMDYIDERAKNYRPYDHEPVVLMNGNLAEEFIESGLSFWAFFFKYPEKIHGVIEIRGM